MNISKLKTFQKSLRRSQTEVEQRIWFYLRNRKFQGSKFRRQHIVEGYIVDFICIEKKLIIEIDGSQHQEQQQYDEMRTKRLKSAGYKVIRFWNTEVLQNIDSVLSAIFNALKD